MKTKENNNYVIKKSINDKVAIFESNQAHNIHYRKT